MRKMHYLQSAIIVSLCLFSPSMFSETAFAENQGGDEKIRAKEVRYFPGGRRDPFLSILKAAEQEQEASEEVEAKSPVEKYDLGQFDLIAILWDETQHLALVGLPDDKHYTLKEGMTIGIHEGKVLKISKESVTIREILPDFRGELKPEDTVIPLHEEEEE